MAEGGKLAMHAVTTQRALAGVLGGLLAAAVVFASPAHADPDDPDSDDRPHQRRRAALNTPSPVRLL
jgi:hypothetical protein